MNSENLFSFLAIVVIFLGLFVFCGIIIKRYWIDKRFAAPGSQAVGESNLMNYADRERRQAIEEMVYHKEDAEERDEEGDDLARFVKTKNIASPDDAR